MMKFAFCAYLAFALSSVGKFGNLTSIFILWEIIQHTNIAFASNSTGENEGNSTSPVAEPLTGNSTLKCYQGFGHISRSVSCHPGVKSCAHIKTGSKDVFYFICSHPHEVEFAAQNLGISDFYSSFSKVFLFTRWKQQGCHSDNVLQYHLSFYW